MIVNQGYDLVPKTAMEIRLFMKEHGWQSEDRLTDMGWGTDENGKPKYCYSIWFERWEWHGRKTLCLTGDKVCFHRHTDSLTDIDHITRLCAEQTLNAYEDYQDCIPRQNSLNKTDKATMFQDWNDERVLTKSKIS